jgi:hypothetical protein
MTTSTQKFQVIYKNGAWHTDSKDIAFIDGTSAEINVDKSMVITQEQTEKFKKPQKFMVFEEGTKLLVALKIPNEVARLDKYKGVYSCPSGYSFAKYKQFSGYYNVANYVLISITLTKTDPPNYLKKTPADGAGWFGLDKAGKSTFTCGAIKLPESLKLSIPRSLNHAYTLLSELLETNRRSHTGNIYKQVFYKESDEQWYPLDKLRNPSDLDNDTFIVSKFWAKICEYKSSSKSE